MPCYRLIENSSQLADLTDLISNHAELAMDLEADSLHHYREKVCLLQFSIRGENWLLDPLQIKDFDRLAQLLAEPSRTVVIHGSDYDIRSLHRDFRITVGKLFDTMVAAQFCGRAEYGLAALLLDQFGVKLDKRFQKADWSIRPLTDEMARYAVLDTAWLLKLAACLRQELIELKRLDWVEEECALLVKNRVTDKSDQPLFLGCKGASRLKPRNLAVLEKLLALREQLACKLDRPAFKVIAADTLLSIAEHLPATKAELATLPGMTQRLFSRLGEQLLQTVQIGLNIPADQYPRFPKGKGESSSELKGELAAMKRVRDRLAEETRLATGLLAPNWLLEKIAERQPADMLQLAAVPGIRQWQLNLWGSDMLKTVNRKV